MGNVGELYCRVSSSTWARESIEGPGVGTHRTEEVGLGMAGGVWMR